MVARIGGVLVAPRRLLAAVARGEGHGGIDDVLLLLVLRVIAGEAPLLAKAFAGVRVLGGLGAIQLVLRAALQVVPDAFAILVGAMLLTLLGGRRGRRGRELDVAGYAWVPYLTVGIVRVLLYSALGRMPSSFEQHAFTAVGLAWSGAVWLLGLVALRSAPAAGTDAEARPHDSASAAPTDKRVFHGSARWAGWGVMAGLGCMLTLQVAWIARNFSSLAPVGTASRAPDFQLPLLGGGEFHLDGGGAPQTTLIDFWATWCGPCREELPVVDRLWRRYRDRGVRFVAVDAEGPEASGAVEALVRSGGLGLPIALGGEAVAERYHVDSLPHVVILDGQGRVKRVFLGLHGEAELARALDDAALPAPGGKRPEGSAALQR